ncbi:hypothetical protein [Niastella yeongjuensis]|nr:hypothetical protein [Niastella yeongjuensis]SEO88051.1 hypothetical protein SAMN05660816_03829 [Niastella yeongjuensis]
MTACGVTKCQLEILPKRVYVASGGYKTGSGYYYANKHVYFLVKGECGNKQQAKAVIDNFAKQAAAKESGSFTNYTIYFYYESDELNEKSIQSEKDDLRYKLFDYNDNEFIAVYTFRESRFSDVVWSKEYE